MPNNKKKKTKQYHVLSADDPSPRFVVFDLLDTLIVSLQIASPKDPVGAFIEGLACYFRNDPFGSQIRLRELLKVFLNNTQPSKHVEHKKLLEVARVSLASENPLELVMLGIVELVSADGSLVKGSTEKEKFYNRLLLNHTAFQRQLALQNTPPPRWIVDAVVLIQAVHCLFWMCTTSAIYKDVVNKDGRLYFTKDNRQKVQRAFIWSDSSFEQVKKKDMEAIFSTNVCEESLNQLAPLIIYVLKDFCYSLEARNVMMKPGSRPTSMRVLHEQGVTQDVEPGTKNESYRYKIPLDDMRMIGDKHRREEHETLLLLRPFGLPQIALMKAMWEAPRLVVKAMQLSLEQWLRKEGFDIAKLFGLGEDYGDTVMDLLMTMIKSSEDLIKMLKQKGK